MHLHDQTEIGAVFRLRDGKHMHEDLPGCGDRIWLPSEVASNWDKSQVVRRLGRVVTTPSGQSCLAPTRSAAEFRGPCKRSVLVAGEKIAPYRLGDCLRDCQRVKFDFGIVQMKFDGPSCDAENLCRISHRLSTRRPSEAFSLSERE